MNRIEVTAILKSAIEAGHTPDQLGNYLQVAAGLLDQYGTDRNPSPTPSIPSVAAAGASAPAAGGVQEHGTATLTLLASEDHGNRVRVTTSGFQSAKYLTAWGDDAAAVRLMAPNTVFSATVVSKPNPNKPGTNYWNIKNVRVQPNNTATAQQVYPQADDIPF